MNNKNQNLRAVKKVLIICLLNCVLFTISIKSFSQKNTPPPIVGDGWKLSVSLKKKYGDSTQYALQGQSLLIIVFEASDSTKSDPPIEVLKIKDATTLRDVVFGEIVSNENMPWQKMTVMSKSPTIVKTFQNGKVGFLYIASMPENKKDFIIEFPDGKTINLQPLL